VSQSFLESWCKALADEFISVNGLKIDDEDRLKIAKAISTGAHRAALTLNRRAKGDYSLDSPFPITTRANDISAVESYNPRPWPSSPLSVGEAANKHNLRSIPAPTPLGAALRNKITLTDGVVDQANFDTYEPLRLSDMPAVDVHIGKSDQPPRRTWRSSHRSDQAFALAKRQSKHGA
jgi:hypothetical protein